MIQTEVKSIETQLEDSDIVEQGKQCGFNIRNVSVKDIKRGNVVGNIKNNPPLPTIRFRAYILIDEHFDSLIIGGCPPTIYCHTLKAMCRIDKILWTICQRTGHIDKNLPRFIKADKIAYVEFYPYGPICIEPYNMFNALGRFTMQYDGKRIGTGIVDYTICHLPNILSYKQIGGSDHGKQKTYNECETQMWETRRKTLFKELYDVKPEIPTDLINIILEYSADYSSFTKDPSYRRTYNW